MNARTGQATSSWSVSASYAATRYRRLTRAGLCYVCGIRKRGKTRKCRICANRAVTSRCSLCLKTGHNKRRCTQPRLPPDPRFVSGNDGYASNRRNKLCDSCGRHSETVYCVVCVRARKLRRKGENARRA